VATGKLLDLLGIRLLNSPRRGSNECHGNAFHNTNSSGSTPVFSNAPQTIVAVGSEKHPHKYSVCSCGVA